MITAHSNSTHIESDCVCSEKKDNTFLKWIHKPEAQKHGFIGQTVLLECVAFGSPTPEIVWRHSFHNKPNHNIIQSSNRAVSFGDSGVVRSRLVLDVKKDMHKEFFCTVDNGIKQMFGYTEVFVHENRECYHFLDRSPHENNTLLPDAPYIKTWTQSAVAKIGQYYLLYCTIKRVEPLAIEWYHANGTKIDRWNDRRYGAYPDGGLEINNVTHEDVGEYTCKAANNYGETSMQMFLFTADSIF
ncbi:zwei Ig domain protein zig-2-like [Panonychus citri]|uniref:zwei Ig domain protein zig-2-like n=1 Tax=Panonychus citri TaxID=50023 RepID=UPI002307B28B|nr:zwei Ig domain protein zig-2-like [Panonychus citri]